MVSWQRFVSLCHSVAEERDNGAESLEESQEILSVASDLWSEGKNELTGASVSEARDYIRRNA